MFCCAPDFVFGTRMCQASYGVEDAEYAITQLAQTTMRSEIGKITLDTVFRERELLNIAIVGEILTYLVVRKSLSAFSV